MNQHIHMNIIRKRTALSSSLGLNYEKTPIRTVKMESFSFVLVIYLLMIGYRWKLFIYVIYLGTN